MDSHIRTECQPSRAAAGVLVLVPALALLVLPRLGVTPATLNAQATGVEMLHRFAFGTMPQSPIGVTAVPEGGALVVSPATSAPSMISRVLPDGTVRVLHTLPFTDGHSGTKLVPAPLVRGGDGGYYGTTRENSSSHGSIIRVDLDGRFSTVYTFQGAADGTAPSALFPGPGGTVYGFTRLSTQFNLVYLVFVIGSDGSVTTNVLAMSARPVSVAPDGAVYGLSVPDGCGAYGVIVRRGASGGEVPVAGPLGSGSNCGDGFTDVLPLTTGGVVALAVRNDRSAAAGTACDLWHVTPNTARAVLTMPEPCWWTVAYRRFRDDGAGGAVGFSDRSVFRVSTTGVATVLTRLPDTGGILTGPLADLDRHADGTLWAVSPSGATFNGGGVMAIPAVGSPALVAAFAGGNHEGHNPTGPVVADADGFLYGVTAVGGDYGAGVVYRVNRTGSRFDVLYSFTGRADGRSPTGLVQTADGAMYGTTDRGDGHEGTVFRVGRSGALTTLFVFRRDLDGRNPGALVVGPDGSLYGRTRFGGQHGWGTAFRVSPSGAMTVLSQFPPPPALPARTSSNSPLTLGLDGQFYGVTASCNFVGCFGGAVFHMTPDGQVGVLWETTSGYDVRPELFQTPDGRLWGSFSNSGAFVITPSGAATFIPVPLEGQIGLKVRTDDGNFVGVATRFAPDYSTSLFQMTPQGRVWEFATMSRRPSGAEPALVTILDGRDGFLYGTTHAEYPATDLGAVFRTARPGPSAPTGIRIVR